MRILGSAAKLLCDRTNSRAKRRLSRSSSDAYKTRWKDLTLGGRLSTFLGVHLGVSIIGVGPRHLMKQKPEWMSQQGEKKLFGKITTDLYRLWSTNLVAHKHRDSILFKKSIREQRIRFYRNKQFSEIIYANSRKARDPPLTISGNETITRLYTQKATDVRMRTKKKNESRILNQNLCGSNKGYSTWKKGDPVGNG